MTSIGIVASGAIAGLILARSLGPAGRGHYAAIVLPAAVVSAVTSLGVEEALVFLLGRSQKEDRARIFSSGLLVATTGGLIGAAATVSISLAMYLPKASSVSLQVAISYSALPLIYNWTQCGLSALRASERYVSWNILRLTVPAAHAVMVSAIALAVTLTVNAAVMSLLLANLSVMALAIGSSRMLITTQVDRRTVTSVLRFGLKYHFITVQAMANQRFDQLVIAAVLPAEQVGYYAIAVTYSSVVLSVGLAPGMQLYSSLSSRGTKGRELADMVHRRTRMLVAPLAALAACLSPFLISAVYGSPFASSVPAAVILCFGLPLISYNAIEAALWKSRARPWRAAGAEALGFCVTLAGLAVLLPLYGFVGAAIASVTAYMATTFTFIVVNRRYQ